METERCIIIKLHSNDYEEVKKIYMNKEVRKYLGGVIPEEHALHKFLDTLERSHTDSYFWVVRLKRSNKLIGLVSLDQHTDGLHMEVSYEFLPQWWGHGYAHEVIKQVLVHAFRDLHLSKVIAETQTANQTSCRLLEKVGMNIEKTVIRYGAEQTIYGIEQSTFDFQ